MSEIEPTKDVAALTVQLLSAYLANNMVASEDLAGVIRTTRDALTGEQPAVQLKTETFTPAVSVRKSLASSEHIISLIDGKSYKTLKRHLASHGLTPDAYRARYNLPASYPMVAPAYAEHRRAVAQRSGLGSRKSAVGMPQTSAPDLAPAAQADLQLGEPSSSGGEGSQSDTAATPKKLAKSAPAKRPAKSTDAKAPQKRREKSKAKARASNSAELSGESPDASQVLADDPSAGATAQKPKRRSKLGLFKNSEPTSDIEAKQTAEDALATGQRQEPASVAPAAKASGPAKRNKRVRKVHGAEAFANDQSENSTAGQNAPTE